MKRMIMAALAFACASVSVAPAFADDINLRTSSGIKKFWDEHKAEHAGN